MAEQKESSVLFSLKELMNLEEDRIKQEDDERKRKEEAEKQARLDAERRAREAEEARLQSDAERRRQEEQRQREEQARLEAIRQAEVEKARHDAENQARLRAMQQQQDHERQLAALSQDKKKKQLTWMVVGIGAVLIFGGIGGGYAFYSSQQESQRIQKLKDAEIAAKQAQLDKLMADLKTQQDQMAAAQAEIANAKSAEDRANAQAKLVAAQEQQRRTQASIATIKKDVSTKSGGTKSDCKCQPGDPLCSCL
jgi:colicin import membrane protein